MELPKKVIVYNDFRKVSRWWIIPAEAYKSSNWQKETSNSLLWLPWNPLGCHFSLMDVRKNMSTTRYQTGAAALHSGCLILRLLRRDVVAPSCNYILVFCCIVARIQPDNSGCQPEFLLSEMKSVENILRYSRGQFLRYLRGNNFENVRVNTSKYLKQFHFQATKN